MIYSDSEPRKSEAKLYQRSKEFKGFQNITKERYEQIKALVQRKLSFIKEAHAKSYRVNNLDIYVDVLHYLTSNRIFSDLPTFDERILFLIEAIDPEMITFRETMAIDIPLLEEIKLESDPKVQAELKTRKRDSLSTAEDKVRKQLGFASPLLSSFEGSYLIQFKSKEHIETPIANRFNFKNLIRRIKGLSLNKISQERYNEIDEMVKQYLSLLQDQPTYTKVAFDIQARKDLFPLTSPEERMIFFILSVDPTLEAYRSHEEESLIAKEAERTIAAIGFYHSGFEKLEEQYHKQFTPDMHISDWLGY